MCKYFVFQCVSLCFSVFLISKKILNYVFYGYKISLSYIFLLFLRLILSNKLIFKYEENYDDSCNDGDDYHG